MKNAICLILPSLYENPGHVLIEAAISNCPIISSDCPTGPAEFLSYGKAGYLFELNNESDLINKVEKFMKQSEEEKIEPFVVPEDWEPTDGVVKKIRELTSWIPKELGKRWWDEIQEERRKRK